MMIERFRFGLFAIVASAMVMACGDQTGPSPCGGTQTAAGFAVMPDTGIAARDTVHVSLSQRETFAYGELAELYIQHIWRPERGPNPGLDPRVRLVRDDGFVLLDTLADRRVPFQPANETRGTWIIGRRFRDAAVRALTYEAIRDSILILELRPRTGEGVGSRARIHTTVASVLPVMECI